ncbi:MAG: methyltransferase domain-containing protein [Candidatus Omnitrophica bacterium]|nr:methyltransferase domain-containing protein [Candidatus Omnitrophota bacterium]
MSQSKTRKPREVHTFAKRAIALFVTICFLSLNVSESLPALYASNFGENNLASSFKLQASGVAIPAELGSIETTYQANPEKTILYIQDAHDSLEAQENIAKLIEHLIEREGVKTVYEEGYDGKVPTDEYFSLIEDAVTKEQVSHYLMDQLRLGGAEYAHINRKKDFNLVGADNIRLHLENVDWYRHTAEVQEETKWDLKTIHEELEILANQNFPKELKEWMKLKDRFDQNTIEVLDYIKRMSQLQKSPEMLRDYPVISLLLAASWMEMENKTLEEEAKAIVPRALFDEIHRFEKDLASGYLAESEDQDIFQYYQGIRLVEKLNNLEVSPAEFDAAKMALQKLPTEQLAPFIAKQKGKSLVLSDWWEESIERAVQFYEAAQSRDRSIDAKLEEFMANPEEDVAILVFGGFHQNAIEEILRDKKLSYQIVTPKITELDEKYRERFRQMMSQGYQPFEVPENLSRAARYPPIFVDGTVMDPEIVKRNIGLLAERLQKIEGASGKGQGARLQDRRSELRTESASWAPQLVLIVEDDTDMANFYARGIREYFPGLPPSHITQVMSVEDARIFLEAGIEYDLVFLDNDLEGDRQGYELLPALRERYPGAVIIFNSANSRARNKVQYDDDFRGLADIVTFGKILTNEEGKRNLKIFLGEAVRHGVAHRSEQRSLPFGRDTDKRFGTGRSEDRQVARPPSKMAGPPLAEMPAVQNQQDSARSELRAFSQIGIDRIGDDYLEFHDNALPEAKIQVRRTGEGYVLGSNRTMETFSTLNPQNEVLAFEIKGDALGRPEEDWHVVVMLPFYREGIYLMRAPKRIFLEDLSGWDLQTLRDIAIAELTKIDEIMAEIAALQGLVRNMLRNPILLPFDDLMASVDEKRKIDESLEVLPSLAQIAVEFNQWQQGLAERLGGVRLVETIRDTSEIEELIKIVRKIRAERERGEKILDRLMLADGRSRRILEPPSSGDSDARSEIRQESQMFAVPDQEDQARSELRKIQTLDSRHQTSDIKPLTLTLSPEGRGMGEGDPRAELRTDESKALTLNEPRRQFIWDLLTEVSDTHRTIQWKSGETYRSLKEFLEERGGQEKGEPGPETEAQVLAFKEEIARRYRQIREKSESPEAKANENQMVSALMKWANEATGTEFRDRVKTIMPYLPRTPYGLAHRNRWMRHLVPGMQIVWPDVLIGVEMEDIPAGEREQLHDLILASLIADFRHVASVTYTITRHALSQRKFDASTVLEEIAAAVSEIQDVTEAYLKKNEKSVKLVNGVPKGLMEMQRDLKEDVPFLYDELGALPAILSEWDEQVDISLEAYRLLDAIRKYSANSKEYLPNIFHAFVRFFIYKWVDSRLSEGSSVPGRFSRFFPQYFPSETAGSIEPLQNLLELLAKVGLRAGVDRTAVLRSLLLIAPNPGSHRLGSMLDRESFYSPAYLQSLMDSEARYSAEEIMKELAYEMAGDVITFEADEINGLQARHDKIVRAVQHWPPVLLILKRHLGWDKILAILLDVKTSEIQVNQRGIDILGAGWLAVPHELEYAQSFGNIVPASGRPQDQYEAAVFGSFYQIFYHRSQDILSGKRSVFDPEEDVPSSVKDVLKSRGLYEKFRSVTKAIDERKADRIKRWLTELHETGDLPARRSLRRLATIPAIPLEVQAGIMDMPWSFDWQSGLVPPELVEKAEGLAGQIQLSRLFRFENGEVLFRRRANVVGQFGLWVPYGRYVVKADLSVMLNQTNPGELGPYTEGEQAILRDTGGTSEYSGEFYVPGTEGEMLHLTADFEIGLLETSPSAGFDIILPTTLMRRLGKRIEEMDLGEGDGRSEVRTKAETRTDARSELHSALIEPSTTRALSRRARSELRPLKDLTWEDEEEVLAHFQALLTELEWPLPREVRVDSGEKPIPAGEWNIGNIRKLAGHMLPYEYHTQLSLSADFPEYFHVYAGPFLKTLGILRNWVVWFRYGEQLAAIRDHVKKLTADQTVNILVHATWNGEDAYAIALMLDYLFPKRKFRIIASDFSSLPDPAKLEWAKLSRVPGFLKSAAGKYFSRKTKDILQFHPERLGKNIRIEFRQGDLLDPADSPKGQDIVVANAVLGQSIIKKQNIVTAIENVWTSLKPGGRFYVDNHSFRGQPEQREKVIRILRDQFAGRFEQVTESIYKKASGRSEVREDSSKLKVQSLKLDQLGKREESPKFTDVSPLTLPSPRRGEGLGEGLKESDVKSSQAPRFTLHSSQDLGRSELRIEGEALQGRLEEIDEAFRRVLNFEPEAADSFKAVEPASSTISKIDQLFRELGPAQEGEERLRGDLYFKRGVAWAIRGRNYLNSIWLKNGLSDLNRALDLLDLDPEGDDEERVRFARIHYWLGIIQASLVDFYKRNLNEDEWAAYQEGIARAHPHFVRSLGQIKFKDGSALSLSDFDTGPPRWDSYTRFFKRFEKQFGPAEGLQNYPWFHPELFMWLAESLYAFQIDDAGTLLVAGDGEGTIRQLIMIDNLFRFALHFQTFSNGTLLFVRRRLVKINKCIRKIEKYVPKKRRQLQASVRDSLGEIIQASLLSRRDARQAVDALTEALMDVVHADVQGHEIWAVYHKVMDWDISDELAERIAEQYREFSGREELRDEFEIPEAVSRNLAKLHNVLDRSRRLTDDFLKARRATHENSDFLEHILGGPVESARSLIFDAEELYSHRKNFDLALRSALSRMKILEEIAGYFSDLDKAQEWAETFLRGTAGGKKSGLEDLRRAAKFVNRGDLTGELAEAIGQLKGSVGMLASEFEEIVQSLIAGEETGVSGSVQSSGAVQTSGKKSSAGEKNPQQTGRRLTDISLWHQIPEMSSLFSEVKIRKRQEMVDDLFREYLESYGMELESEFLIDKKESRLKRLFGKIFSFLNFTSIDKTSYNVVIKEFLEMIGIGIPAGIVRTLAWRLYAGIRRLLSLPPYRIDPRSPRGAKLIERMRTSIDNAPTLEEKRRLQKGYRKYRGYLWAERVMMRFEETPYDLNEISSVTKTSPRELLVQTLGGVFRRLLKRKEGKIQDQKDKEILEFLIERLRDKDPWVVKAAVWGIGAVSDHLDDVSKQVILDEYFKILEGARTNGAEQEDIVSRGAVARGLREVVSPQSLSKLQEFLGKEKSEWVQTYIAEAIEYLIHHYDTEAVTYHYGKGLRKLLLEKAVGKPDERRSFIMLRVASIKALARLERYDKEVFYALEQMFLFDPDSTVQEASLWALARLYVSSQEGMQRIDHFIGILMDYLRGEHNGRKNPLLENYARNLLRKLLRYSQDEALKKEARTLVTQAQPLSFFERMVLWGSRRLTLERGSVMKVLDKVLEHLVRDLKGDPLPERFRSFFSRHIESLAEKKKARPGEEPFKGTNPVILLDIDPLVPVSGKDAARGSEADSVFDLVKVLLTRQWSVVISDRYREARDSSKYHNLSGAEMALRTDILADSLRKLVYNRPIRIPSRDDVRGKPDRRLNGVLVPVRGKPIVVFSGGNEMWLSEDLLVVDPVAKLDIKDYPEILAGGDFNRLMQDIEDAVKKSELRIANPSQQEMERARRELAQEIQTAMDGILEYLQGYFKRAGDFEARVIQTTRRLRQVTVASAGTEEIMQIVQNQFVPGYRDYIQASNVIETTEEESGEFSVFILSPAFFGVPLEELYTYRAEVAALRAFYEKQVPLADQLREAPAKLLDQIHTLLDQKGKEKRSELRQMMIPEPVLFLGTVAVGFSLLLYAGARNVRRASSIHPDRIRDIRRRIQDDHNPNFVGVLIAPDQTKTGPLRLRVRPIFRRGHPKMRYTGRDKRSVSNIQRLSFIPNGFFGSLILEGSRGERDYTKLDKSVRRLLLPYRRWGLSASFGLSEEKPLFDDWTAVTRNPELDGEVIKLLRDRISALRGWRAELRKDLETRDWRLETGGQERQAHSERHFPLTLSLSPKGRGLGEGLTNVVRGPWDVVRHVRSELRTVDIKTRIIRKLEAVLRPALFPWLAEEGVKRNIALWILRHLVDTSVPLVADIGPDKEGSETVLPPEQVEQFFRELLPAYSTFSFPKRNFERVSRYFVLGIPFYIARDPETGVMYQEALPGREYLDLIYSDWYLQSPLRPYFGFADDSKVDWARRLKASEKRAEELMKAYREFFPGAASDSFVDIGSGRNIVAWAATLKQAGWGKVTMVEPYLSSPDQIEELQRWGAEYSQGMEALIRDGKKFQGVSALMVLEHVLDPLNFLKQMAAIMETGGILFLRIPNTPEAGVPAASIMEHINHFDGESIKPLLRKAGFEFVTSVYSPSVHTAQSIGMAVIARRSELHESDVVAEGTQSVETEASLERQLQLLLGLFERAKMNKEKLEYILQELFGDEVIDQYRKVLNSLLRDYQPFFYNADGSMFRVTMTDEEVVSLLTKGAYQYTGEKSSFGNELLDISGLFYSLVRETGKQPVVLVFSTDFYNHLARYGLVRRTFSGDFHERYFSFAPGYALRAEDLDYILVDRKTYQEMDADILPQLRSKIIVYDFPEQNDNFLPYMLLERLRRDVLEPRDIVEAKQTESRQLPLHVYPHFDSKEAPIPNELIFLLMPEMKEVRERLLNDESRVLRLANAVERSELKKGQTGDRSLPAEALVKAGLETGDQEKQAHSERHFPLTLSLSPEGRGLGEGIVTLPKAHRSESREFWSGEPLFLDLEKEGFVQVESRMHPGFGESDRYPIYQKEDRKIIVKNRALTLWFYPLMERLAYEIASRAGIETSPVWLVRMPSGKIRAAIEMWPESEMLLYKDPLFGRIIHASELARRNPKLVIVAPLSVDYSEWIPRLARPEQFVGSDILRFFMSHGDSWDPRQVLVRKVKEEADKAGLWEARFIDYEMSLVQFMIDPSNFKQYLKDEKEILAQYGIKFLENLAGISDEDIEQLIRDLFAGGEPDFPGWPLDYVRQHILDGLRGSRDSVREALPEIRKTAQGRSELRDDSSKLKVPSSKLEQLETRDLKLETQKSEQRFHTEKVTFAGKRYEFQEIPEDTIFEVRVTGLRIDEAFTGKSGVHLEKFENINEFAMGLVKAHREDRDRETLLSPLTAAQQQLLDRAFQEVYQWDKKSFYLLVQGLPQDELALLNEIVMSFFPARERELMREIQVVNGEMVGASREQKFLQAQAHQLSLLVLRLLKDREFFRYYVRSVERNLNRWKTQAVRGRFIPQIVNSIWIQYYYSFSDYLPMDAETARASRIFLDRNIPTGFVNAESLNAKWLKDIQWILPHRAGQPFYHLNVSEPARVGKTLEQFFQDEEGDYLNVGEGGAMVAGNGETPFLLVSDAVDAGELREFEAWLKGRVPAYQGLKTYTLPGAYTTLRKGDEYFLLGNDHLDTVMGFIPRHFTDLDQDLLLIDPLYHGEMQSNEEFQRFLREQNVRVVEVDPSETHFNPANFVNYLDETLFFNYSPKTIAQLKLKKGMYQTIEAEDDAFIGLAALGAGLSCLIGLKPFVSLKEILRHPASKTVVEKKMTEIISEIIRDEDLTAKQKKKSGEERKKIIRQLIALGGSRNITRGTIGEILRGVLNRGFVGSGRFDEIVRRLEAAFDQPVMRSEMRDVTAQGLGTGDFEAGRTKLENHAGAVLIKSGNLSPAAIPGEHTEMREADFETEEDIVQGLETYLNGEQVVISWPYGSWGEVQAYLSELEPVDSRLYRLSVRADAVWASQQKGLKSLFDPGFLPGAFGQILLDFSFMQTAEGQAVPALIIREIQPSGGFRALNKAKRQRLAPWREKAIEKVLKWAKSRGVDVFAATGSIIKDYYPYDFSDYELKSNYLAPFVGDQWTVAELPTEIIYFWESFPTYLPDTNHQGLKKFPWHVFTGNRSISRERSELHSTPAELSTARVSARRPRSELREDISKLDWSERLNIVHHKIQEGLTPPVLLTDEEIRTYFGEEVLEKSKLEGKQFYLRLLTPEDQKFLEDWKRGLAEDREWRTWWHSRPNGPHKDLPYFPGLVFSGFNIGLVSKMEGEEYLEGYFLGEPILRGFDTDAKMFTFKLAIPRMELSYKNIGERAQIQGVSDLLFDYLIKFAADDTHFIRHGISFNPATPGSHSFVERRALEKVGGQRGLTQKGIVSEFGRRGLERMFNTRQSELRRTFVQTFDRESVETLWYPASGQDDAETLAKAVKVFPNLHTAVFQTLDIGKFRLGTTAGHQQTVLWKALRHSGFTVLGETLQFDGDFNKPLPQGGHYSFKIRKPDGNELTLWFLHEDAYRDLPEGMGISGPFDATVLELPGDGSELAKDQNFWDKVFRMTKQVVLNGTPFLPEDLREFVPLHPAQTLDLQRQLEFRSVHHGEPGFVQPWFPGYMNILVRPPLTGEASRNNLELMPPGFDETLDKLQRAFSQLLYEIQHREGFLDLMKHANTRSKRPVGLILGEKLGFPVLHLHTHRYENETSRQPFTLKDPSFVVSPGIQAGRLTLNLSIYGEVPEGHGLWYLYQDLVFRLEQVIAKEFGMTFVNHTVKSKDKIIPRSELRRPKTEDQRPQTNKAPLTLSLSPEGRGVGERSTAGKTAEELRTRNYGLGTNDFKRRGPQEVPANTYHSSESWEASPVFETGDRRQETGGRHPASSLKPLASVDQAHLQFRKLMRKMDEKFTVFVDTEDAAKLTEAQLEEFEMMAHLYKGVKLIFYNDQGQISSPVRSRLELLREELGAHRILFDRDQAASVFRLYGGKDKAIHISKGEIRADLLSRVPKKKDFYFFRYLDRETGLLPVALLYAYKDRDTEGRVMDLTTVNQKLLAEIQQYMTHLVFARAA